MRDIKIREKSLKKLAQILKKADYTDTEYCFGGYLEDAVCLQKVDDTYQVYTAFRGRKEDLTFHNDFYEAVSAFLEELCCDEEEASDLLKKYKECL